MNTKYLYILLLFITSSALLGQNQNYIFDHIKVEDGLSQSSVNDILVDNFGFMWFCTEHGLNRYDGKEFKTFTSEEDNPNRISHYRIFCGITDNEGSLWIGTEVGLNRMDLTSTKIYNYYFHLDSSSSINHNEIRSLYIDEENTLWIGTGNGINKYNPATDNFDQFFLSTIESNEIKVITIEPDSKDNSILWLGTNGSGLVRFDKNSGDYEFFNFRGENSTFDTNIVNTIKIVETGELYIGTHGGFIIFDPISEKFKDYHSFQIEGYSFSTDRITDIEFMPDGKLWFATWNDGIIITDKNLGNPINIRHNPRDQQSLSNNRALKLFEQNNIAWIGTYSGGINKFDFSLRKFSVVRSVHRDPASLLSNEIWGFFEDSRDRFWVCTDKGLDLLNRNDNTFTHFTTETSGISDNDVFAMAETPDGYLWIGTRGGLNRMNPDTYGIKQYRVGQDTGLSDDVVITMYVDNEGILWAGTLRGLNKYNKKDDRFIAYLPNPEIEGSLSDEQIFSINQDADNNLWIGTNQGLNKFNKEKNHFEVYLHDPDNNESISNNRVYSIFFDSDGVFWIATLGGGFNRFDVKNNLFRHYREADGLANDVVYGVLEDDNKNLWISTNNGISKFNRRTKSFHNYNSDDGLQSNEFNYGAYYKAKNGELFFGGVNGFNSFNPEDIQLNSSPPKTAITGLRVLNKQISPLTSEKLSSDIIFADSFELDYDENVFSIEFAALSFAAPDKNQFAYKIEEINEDWIFNSNRNIVTFANLPPGNYSFKVIGANNDNVWDQEGASIKIEIKPPYWKTWWAFVIYFIALVILIWVIIYYRNRILKREIEVLQQADRLKSEFLAQMSHEIRSPINIILSFSSLLKSEVEEYLDDEMREGFQSIHNAGDRIIRTIDLILNMSEIQTGIYDFRPEKIDLYEDVFIKLFLEYNQKAKEKNLDFNIENSSDTGSINGDLYTVTQIFANLIDNAIKYTDKGSIKITISNRIKDIEVSVNDTGRGILPEYLPKLYDSFTQEDQSYTRQFEGSGLGLALVKKYCELNEAKIFVESDKGKGTNFKVVFDKVIGE